MADVTVPEPPSLAPIKKHAVAPSKRKKVRKRLGQPSAIEKKLLEDVLRQQTTELTPTQERSLGHVFQRGPGVIKKMIQEAREKFAERAGEYVDIHYQAATGALADGKYEVAGDLAQWAMKEIASEGVRIIDRPSEVVNVPKVMIGVKLGGIGTTPEVAVAVEGGVVAE